MVSVECTKGSEQMRIIANKPEKDSRNNVSSGVWRNG
jgi:hypothetical protein